MGQDAMSAGCNQNSGVLTCLTHQDETRGVANLWATSKIAPLLEVLSDGVTVSRSKSLNGTAECARSTLIVSTWRKVAALH